MTKLLVVGLGGFVGAVLRYGLTNLVERRIGGSFPWGTLCVNVIGCVAIGVLWSLVEERRLVSPDLQLLVGVGFLGGLTTFSTFGHETFELLQLGATRLAIVAVLANVALGLGGVGLGRWLGRLFA